MVAKETGSAGVNSVATDLLAKFADELHEAELARRPMESLTKRFTGLTAEDAYRIQLMNIQRRVAAGERIIGHKIGLTARAMQIKFNVDTPDYGHLMDTMVLTPGMALDMSELIDPQIEVEPAFVLGRELAGPGVTLDDVMQAIEYTCVCFEVIDSRITNWAIKLQDTVADNGSSSRLLLGAARIDPNDVALDNLATDLEVDGRVVESGNTNAILDHPGNGVVWLANAVAKFGVVFEAGHIILPGTSTRSFRLSGCKVARGRIAGLGEVELRLSGKPYSKNTDIRGNSD
jgi:2-keto-4-pentenoate hydratase